MIIPSVSNIFDFDWYGRNGQLVAGETSYSSFVVNNETAKKLVGSNPLTNINSLSWFLTRFSMAVSQSHNIVYINNKSDDSYTYGNSIMVSSLPKWENPENTAYWRLDTYIGLALHEACHCRYSDFYTLNKTSLTKTELWLTNVIEDEAIENTLRNRRRGYGKFIDNIKATQFNIENFNVVDNDNELQTILNILFAIIRIPNFISSVLNADQKAKYGNLFFNIYNIMNMNGSIIKIENDTTICNTSKNIESAKQVCKLIKEFCGCDDKKMDDQKKQKSSPHDSSNNNNDSNEQNDNDNNNELSEAELNKILKELENEFGDNINEMLSDISVLDNDLKEIENNIVTSIESKTWKNGGKSNKTDINQFNKYKQIVYPYINKVVNLLTIKNNKLNYKTERYSISGSIDGACIASAFTGNKFTNKRIVRKDTKSNKKLAVVLIADNSGSMQINKAGDNSGALVTLFSEAVMKLPNCELYVYTHNDTLNEICSSSSYNKDKYNIGTISAKHAEGGQNEVASYKSAIETTRKHTDLPICLINFTDSEYCSPVSNIKETIEQLKLNSNCNISLISVNEKKRCKANDRIYGENNYINIHSLRPSEMTEMIKKATNIISKMYK